MLVIGSTVSFWIFTALTLAGAEYRRRQLKRLGLNGSRRRYANRVVRHESLRLVKHTILVAMVIAVALDIRNLLAWRNAGVMVVSALLGLNSLLDLIDRRAGLRGFLAKKRQSTP